MRVRQSSSGSRRLRVDASLQGCEEHEDDGAKVATWRAGVTMVQRREPIDLLTADTTP